MGMLIGVLISAIATLVLSGTYLNVAKEDRKINRLENLGDKVAEQLYTVFNASYLYIQGIGASPSTWSIAELKSKKLLPTSFGDRSALGQTYVGAFVQDRCDGKVMDIIVKMEDTEDDENLRLWEKSGLPFHELSKRRVYAGIAQVLEQFTYPKDMKNPCGAGLPSYEVGYILNGQVYVNGRLRTDLNIPSSMLSRDGVFIYGYAPNQWGYLVVSFRLYNSYNTPRAEAYSWSPSTSELWIYMDEHDGWRVASLSWQPSCPLGYTDLSTLSIGAEMSVNSGYLNFCIPAFKSDVSQSIVNRFAGEFKKYYGVNKSFSESNGCVVAGGWAGHQSRFTYDLSTYLGAVITERCSNYSDPTLDGEFASRVSRWLYVVHKNAWKWVKGADRSKEWLQQNEPLVAYPQPNFFIFRSITIQDRLIPGRYYQFVAYVYRFYTGQGCSPSSLGISGTSALTGITYPSNATIWATGWQAPGFTTPTDVGTDTSCSSSWLDGEYENLGTSQRFVDTRTMVRVVGSQADASQYIVPVTYRDGKFGQQRTFNWVIPTPIY